MVVFAAIAMVPRARQYPNHEATFARGRFKERCCRRKRSARNSFLPLLPSEGLGYIEGYAENVLGMVKSTDVAKHYVSISGEDKIAVGGVGVNAAQDMGTQNASAN